MTEDIIREYIQGTGKGSIKVAINDPADGVLRFYKIELGRLTRGRDWRGYVFLRDITVSSRRNESISIRDSRQRESIYARIVEDGINECVERYNRESTEYEMSTHPINDERVQLASQEEIERRFIPFMWNRQTEYEQRRRLTREWNEVGFNKSDASFFSHMVKDKLNRGIRLNAVEIENIKRRLCRYSRQLSEMPT